MEKKGESLKSKLKSVALIDLIYTVLLFLNYFSYGISVNIYGPSMVDLAMLYEVELKMASNLLVANILGYLVGTLAGWTYQWLNRQLMFSIFTLLLAVANGLLPLYGSIQLAFGGIFVSGLGMGVLRSSASCWLIDLWPVGSTAILQACQFLYGLGMITAPMMTSKFIYGDKNVTSSGEVLTVELRKKNLMVPFAINGVLQAIPPLCLFVLFFVKRYRPATTQSPRKSIDFNHRNSIFEIPQLPKLQASAVSFRKTKLAICCFLYAIYFTAETGYFPYASSMWQYLPVKLSASEAANVMSCLCAAYTIGPVVTAFVSVYVKVDNIISYHFGLLFTGITILYFGKLSRTWIYTGSAVLGFAMTPMIPAINTYVNNHLKLTNQVSSIFSFASGIAAMATPLVIGPLLKTQPIFLLYLTCSLLVISLTLFIVMRVWLILFK